MQSRRWSSGLPTVRALPRLARHRCLHIPAPAVWSQSSIPARSRTIRFCALLNAIGLHRVGVVTTRSSSYARSACGLAVVALQLEDIDWRRRATGSQWTNRVDRLASAKWAKRWRSRLSEARPRCSSRQVFLRAQAPMEVLQRNCCCSDRPPRLSAPASMRRAREPMCSVIRWPHDCCARVVTARDRRSAASPPAADNDDLCEGGLSSCGPSLLLRPGGAQ
jgi:hypothetical protein